MVRRQAGGEEGEGCEVSDRREWVPCLDFPTGIAKVLFNKDTEELLGVHIIGLHAADLIQECSNAMAAGSTVRDLSYMVKAFCLTQTP